MLIDHLGHGVPQQNYILVEGFDLALELDAVDEINRDRNMFLAKQIQKRVL
jgi:hypothetical protein